MIRTFNIALLTLISLVATAQYHEQGRLMSNSGTTSAPGISAHATTNAFSEIDDKIAYFLPDYFTDHRAVVRHLANSYKDDLSIARGIYTWIATNISYDSRALEGSGQPGPQNASHVWAERLAVCEGFANLFNEMCTMAGVESRLVKGYVHNPSGEELIYPNHAWNSVKIMGKWHLIDVTWASINLESISKENRSGISNQLNNHFLIAPETMILTHLPEDPLWQLQNNYIDIATFSKGDSAVKSMLQTKSCSNKDFEQLISDYERLDSLDRSIAYLERMETTKYSNVKEYGLGIGYYYKAQEILKNTRHADGKSIQSVKNKARSYYQKSLENLEKLDQEDLGYEICRELANNVVFRLETLQ